MSDSSNNDSSRESVAFELMKYIIRSVPGEKQNEFNSEERIIELYTKCREATWGRKIEQIYPKG